MSVRRRAETSPARGRLRRDSTPPACANARGDSCSPRSLRRDLDGVYSAEKDSLRMIDGIDAKIVTILQSDGRTSNAEIARQVNLAASAVFERVRKLEERGVIRGYHAQVDPRAIGQSLLAF